MSPYKMFCGKIMDLKRCKIFRITFLVILFKHFDKFFIVKFSISILKEI